MQQHRLRTLTIISIAIFIGGIVFIAIGIGIFSKVASYTEAAVQDYVNNQTSGSLIAKTVTDAMTPHIKTFAHISKGFMTSIAAFLCLVGVGICALGFGLFKVKYLACIITVALMFVAIVIDVLGLGFVGGSLPGSPDEKGIMSVDFAYLLIGIMIAHLVANAFIIYYLTRKTTISIFRA